jgi:hypothetical protein
MVHTTSANGGQLCASSINSISHMLMNGQKFTERQQLRLALSLSASNRDIDLEAQGLAPSSLQKPNVAASPRTRVATTARHIGKQTDSPKTNNLNIIDFKASSKDRGIRSKGKRRPTFVAKFDYKKVIKKLLDISDRVPFSGVKDSNVQASA